VPEAHGQAAPAEHVAALAADQAERNLAARIVADERGGGLDDVRVEAAAEAAIAGDDDERGPVSAPAPRSSGWLV
jgi:hypothetical protein